MIRALWIGLLIVAATGCGQKAKEFVQGGTGTGNSSQQNTDDKVSNTTETSICLKPASSPPSLYTSWSFDWKQGNGLEVHQVFTYKAHSLTNRVRCTAHGLTAIAEVEAPVLYSGNQVEILQTQTSSASIGDGHLEVVCPARLDKGDTMIFSFQGPCLKLKTENGFLLLVPEASTALDTVLPPTENEDSL